MSPDVFDVDGSTHYKFPAVALLHHQSASPGARSPGAVAFGGCLSAAAGPEALPAFVEAYKSTVPMLVYPTKLALAFPFVFHTLGGFRHIVWDKTTSGIDNDPRARRAWRSSPRPASEPPRSPGTRSDATASRASWMKSGGAFGAFGCRG